MIKLRMDVDYAYPSRMKSFLFTALNRSVKGNYLKNAKIIARMVNESPEEVMAYWFFTPHTVPDKEMLELMHPDRHESALHVATDPYKELAVLERITNQKLRFYTIHGTARRFARLIWHRKLSQARVPIPEDFPLKNFWDFPTTSLDLVVYGKNNAEAKKIAEDAVAKGDVLHIHPEWLFQKGAMNHRGPYYDALKEVLKADKDLDWLAVRKKGFFKVANFGLTKEYERDFVPTPQFLRKLTDRGVDVFTFIERKWCCPISNSPKNWVRKEDNVGLLHLATYDEWWNTIGKKTRNMVRKAEKSGVTTTMEPASEKLAEGIWKIFNETPIRQGRPFLHYGEPLISVRNGVFSNQNSVFIASYYENELAGFIELVIGDNIAIISQILSLQRLWDKAINNALVSKAIEVAAEKKIQWAMYGRMGNHPSLDNFKQSNCFKMFCFSRYYVPLSKKGAIAVKLGLQRDLKDALPSWIKRPLFPVFSWVSRLGTRKQDKNGAHAEQTASTSPTNS